MSLLMGNRAKFLSYAERILFGGILVLAAVKLVSKFDGHEGTARIALELFRYLVMLTFLFSASIPKQQKITLISALAILGSFISPALIVIDRTPQNLLVFVFGCAAVLFYLFFLFYAYLKLGRNLGIVPALRNLVIDGAYGLVRHPIYAAYIYLMSCVVLFSPTFWNFTVLGVFVGCIHVRAVSEEEILSQVPQFAEYRVRVKRRFLSPFLIFPLLIVIAASFIFRGSPVNARTTFEKKVRVKFAYPVMSLNPSIYDDWSSLFVVNHILIRLLAEPDRQAAGLFQSLQAECSDSSCRRSRLKFNWPEIFDCRNLNVPSQVLTREFWDIVRFHNWVLPSANKCEADTHVCIEFDSVEDLQRRLKNVYFRFGWSLPVDSEPVGTGDYCLHQPEFGRQEQIQAGLLVPRNGGPAIQFNVAPIEDANFDLTPYGSEELVNDQYANLDSNTPLAYFLVANHRADRQKCTVWRSQKFLETIRKHFVAEKIVHDDVSAFSFFGDFPKTGCTSPISAGGKIFLPDYLPKCQILANALNEMAGGAKLEIACVDTTRFIQDSVVGRKSDWAAFVSPLSPGYPGRGAIETQYFHPLSRLSWTMDAAHPRKNHWIIGVGRSYTTVRKTVFCGINPSPLGLGDLLISDLEKCR